MAVIAVGAFCLFAPVNGRETDVASLISLGSEAGKGNVTLRLACVVRRHDAG